MKLKTILCLLILSTMIFSVKNVDYYNGKFSIVTENYVLQLPQSLAEKAVLNHDYLISLVPSIKVNGDALTIAPSISPELINTPKSSFSFQVASEKNSVKIEEKIRIEEKQIISDIKITSNRDEISTISIYYPINAKNEKTVFMPDLFSEKEEKYFVFMNTNLKGNALGLTFSSPMNLETQKIFILNTSSYGILSKEVQLKKGQSFRIKAIYYPFNLQVKNESVFPLKYSSHLENIYIELIGKTLEPETTVSDKIDQILETTGSFEKTGDGELLVIHSVNLNSPSDSLDFAMYFKEMSSKMNVPTKLVIGKKDNFYYAWVQAYFGKWVDVDVFAGEREKPSGYSLVYLEPTVEMHYLQDSGDIHKDIYDSTAWLKSTQESGFMIYLILLIIAAIIIGIIISFKATDLSQRLKFESIEKQHLGGKYKILKNEKISDPFINDVFTAVCNKNGEVDLNNMAEEFHYSKDLISFAVAYLSDNDFIIKKSEVIEKDEKKKTEPKTDLNLFSLKKEQKIAIGAIIGIAIILITFLLFGLN